MLVTRAMLPLVLCVSAAPAPAPALTDINDNFTLPAGWTMSIGPIESGEKGKADPNTMHITLNQETVYSGGDSANNFAITLAVAHHEVQHAWLHHNGVEQDPCTEIEIIHEAAAVQAEQIAESCAAGLDMSGACQMYLDVQKQMNEGVATDGGEAAWNKEDCDGDYPGPIPDVPCCSPE